MSDQPAEGAGTPDPLTDTASVQEVLIRVLCHALIDRLPAAALQDVAENIVDTFSAHAPRPSYLRALPPATSAPASARCRSRR